jgi:hypothetical protein
MAEVVTTGFEIHRQRFYFYLSLLMWAIVLIGFVPGFFRPRPDPTLLQNPAVHLHALVYFGWLGLVSYQMRLPSVGRVADHRRLGQWLVAYGALIVVVGLWVALSRFGDNLETGGSALARARLMAPFSDMLIFPVLFGLAVGFRKQAETHKRLMVLACCMLTVAGAGRVMRVFELTGYLAFVAIWLSPIWIGLARDLVVYRRLHPVYLIGGLLMALIPMRQALIETSQWTQFTDWLASTLR